jgi:hypothetical protein
VGSCIGIAFHKQDGDIVLIEMLAGIR